MEFNEATLEPTYRLLHGLAGASSGLKIAERLGLPASLLRDATAFLESGETEIAHYAEELRRRISDLEADKAALTAAQQEFETWRQRELSQIKDQQKLEIARTERRLEEIAKEMAERFARELQSVQDEALRKKLHRKLENVKAHASAQIREEKTKAYAGLIFLHQSPKNLNKVYEKITITAASSIYLPCHCTAIPTQLGIAE